MAGFCDYYIGTMRENTFTVRTAEDDRIIKGSFAMQHFCINGELAACAEIKDISMQFCDIAGCGQIFVWGYGALLRMPLCIAFAPIRCRCEGTRMWWPVLWLTNWLGSLGRSQSVMEYLTSGQMQWLYDSAAVLVPRTTFRFCDS